jgi:hypothetical protein
MLYNDGMAKTMTYILRRIDPAFWRRVRAKAALEGISLNTLILKLLTKWLGVFVLAALCSACGNQPFAPSGAGDAFTYPPMLAPVLAAIDQDPWIHPLLNDRLGSYVRRNLAGIVLDYSLPAEIGATFNRETHLLHWNPRNTPETMAIVKLAGVLLHEARHGEGFRHDCDGRDRTFTQGGAFAVQILYLEQQQFGNDAAGLRRDWIGCS